MKKGEIKHPINPSPNSKMSPYSPSSSNEQQTLQSSSQNILVLKKYKLDNLNIPRDTKDNSPSLSRSLKTPLSSNLISNNLLHSIKSKKLNQTESIQPIDDKKSTYSFIQLFYPPLINRKIMYPSPKIGTNLTLLKKITL